MEKERISYNSKAVYLLIEPSLITPIWFSESVEGIRNAALRQKKTITFLDGIDEIDRLEKKPSALIIVSTDDEWTVSVLDVCRRENIRAILIGGMPSKFGEDVSGTVYSNRSSVTELLNYFKSCDRKNIALLGIDYASSNDAAKAENFLFAAHSLGLPVTSDDIYTNSENSRNPNESFLSNISRYNAVLCSNDYIASYILFYAKENSIRVPEDLYVAGLGDNPLCKYTTPSITSASRSYYNSGEQAFNIWKQITSNPLIFSIVVTVQCEIIPRGSTNFSPIPNHIDVQQPDNSLIVPTESVFQCSNRIKGLANCLTNCDKLDMEIIKGIIEGESTEAIAERLFISEGTARYRLKKIYASSNTDSRKDFIDLFTRYIGTSLIFSDTTLNNTD